MASGFIIFKDGRCFARRWTVYEEILKSAIEELNQITGGTELAQWLSMQIPNPNEEAAADAGWGFYDERQEKWVNRSLDIRSLSQNSQSLFWQAIERTKEKLENEPKNDAAIDLEMLNDLMEMHRLSEIGEPPLERSDWHKIADPCTERNGPGWDS